MIRKCGICDKSFKSLGRHVKCFHKVDFKEYYDEYLKKDENEGHCVICGALTTFYTFRVGYLKTCSSKCNAKRQWQNPQFRKIQIERMRSVVKKIWDSPLRKSEQLRLIAEGLKLLPNKKETFLFTTYLKKLDFVYTGDGKTPLAGKWPDFINKKKKIVIELYGTYWHRNDTKEEIQNRISLFKKMGYKTYIIWENELEDKNLMNKKIKNILRAAK